MPLMTVSAIATMSSFMASPQVLRALPRRRSSKVSAEAVIENAPTSGRAAFIASVSRGSVCLFSGMRGVLYARLRAQDLLIFAQHSHRRFGDLCRVALADLDHDVNVPTQLAGPARLFVRRQVGKGAEVLPRNFVGGPAYVGGRTDVLRGHWHISSAAEISRVARQ